jgi:predicted RNA-binding protein with PIN domain
MTAEPTLYLFDGSNLLHAGGVGSRDALVDALAGFLALRGARGVVVFDGAGADRVVGSLAVRSHAHADDLIERLAAEHRDQDRVAVVSSDRLIVLATGQGVQHRDSESFLRELTQPGDVRASEPSAPSRLEDRLDQPTRARLERFRRGQR